jgi:hypothetical protein
MSKSTSKPRPRNAPLCYTHICPVIGRHDCREGRQAVDTEWSGKHDHDALVRHDLPALVFNIDIRTLGDKDEDNARCYPGRDRDCSE